MANEFIARKGLKVLGSGVEVTGSSRFSTDVTSSGNIKATAFYGDGANVTGVVSASYATTASLATNNLTTASAVGSTITFTKGDGSTFPVTITTATSATASYVEYTNVANKPTLVSASSQIDHNATTNYVANQHIDHSTVNISAGSGLSGGGDITATRTLTLDTSSAHFTGGVKTKLNTDGVFSSSAQVSYTGLSNVPAGIVSSSGQIDVRNTTGIATIATTGSNTFNGTEIISGNIVLASDGQIRIVNDTQSTLFGFYDGSNILGAYYQMWGTNHASTTQRGTAEFVYDNRSNANANFHVASFNGVTWTQKFNVNDTGAQVTGSLGISGGVTASAYTGSFVGDGSGLTGIATALTISGSAGGTDVVNLKTDTLVFAGTNGVTTTVSDNTLTIAIPTGTVSSSGQVSYTGLSNVPAGIVSSSGQVDHNATTNYVANQHVDHSTVNITAGSGLSGGGDITTTRTITLDTSSAHFTGGVKNKLNTDGVFSSSAQVQYGSISGVPAGIVSSSGQVSYTGLSNVPVGIVSSSGQVDVRNTTGIGTIATTGSNSFTGIQTITNTTNSTNYTDGALVVQGGVGIAKDVNISGSLTVTGLLTATSMSTQYVTSSQYTIGTSRIILNDNDLVRFAGLSVVDSGSTAGTGSLLWDSLNNRWIYQADDLAYNSAVIIAGPKNYGSLGDEVGLTAGRIPVAVGDDHIDTNPASSSLYVDFTNGKVYVENGLYVTGSVSSSVGFWGDGSNLTGVVSTLAVTGSDGVSITTGTVNLKTQAITYSAGEGIDISVSGQTVSIAGEDASTTNKGIAVFNSSNFTVTSGQVTASAITFNGTPLNLGGTYAFGLQNITSQGASTSDQLTLSGGAIISGILHTSATATVTSPVNSVVATVATGSYDAAHFDYVLKSSTNLRTGTVLAVWQTGSTNIEFTDTSTADLGDTLSESFTVDLLSGNARLKLTGDANTWTVKTAIRMI